ncbi:chitosanase [Myxococcus sp. CA051A]|uniref:chitosanase n=1 Tax=unclassified Myxococcus TaxID=2648731 RepID=UPI00157BB531|nr:MULTISPECIES: chitosanase [unclassified Myxococcus]NTX05110.1 chitosanase [Myxococcus sp. CA040A]NTX61432.1 chitosanase [Myxococcus sp. CA051A]
MGQRRNDSLWMKWGMLVWVGAAVAGCAPEAGEDGAEVGQAEQGLAACSYVITTNTYVGADWWGTLVFQNTGTSAMTSPTIAFGVPSGVTCDHDEPGWTHTQSGSTCTYSRTSGLTVGVNASYTFYYSTNTNTSFTATNVVISDPSCGGTVPPVTGLTANQKKVAEALTSIWENDTPTIDYAYSENIQDGRGYTNGRAGFCTGTGDAIQVIQCYNARRSAANGNIMAKYMPGLTTINNRFLSTGQSQPSTSELDVIGNWTADWATSYNNTTTRADFKACQDQVSDQFYYTPAMNEANKWGATQALSKMALYDAYINHGESGVKSLTRATNIALGNTGQVAPSVGYNGITESAWLQKFIEKRRDVLAADSTWVDAIDRIAAYEKLRRRGNWDLSAAVRNDVRARDCWTTTYPFSGYTVRNINADGTWSTPATYTFSCN